MRRKKFIVIAVAALVIVAVLIVVIAIRPSVLARLNDRSSSPEGSVESSSAVVDGKIDGHDTVGEYGSKVGQTQQVGNLEITITRVITGTKIAKNGLPSVVTLQVTNKGATEVTIDPQSWSAIDRSEGDVPQALKGDFTAAQQVAPKQTITRQLYFESSDLGRVVYSADDADATQLTWHIQ
ncbi:MAG: DUF4352 domain-containing protein [Coriobacteriia bacterium]|nr:DUF4352 domain-containing protein [Coriobacteriia bacterium]